MKTLEQKPHKITRKNWSNALQETDTLSKWIALYEAINIIGEKCEEREIDFEEFYLDHIKITKYVNEVSKNYQRTLLRDLYNIDIFYMNDSDISK